MPRPSNRDPPVVVAAAWRQAPSQPGAQRRARCRGADPTTIWPAGAAGAAPQQHPCASPCWFVLHLPFDLLRLPSRQGGRGRSVCGGHRASCHATRRRAARAAGRKWGGRLVGAALKRRSGADPGRTAGGKTARRPSSPPTFAPATLTRSWTRAHALWAAKRCAPSAGPGCHQNRLGHAHPACSIRCAPWLPSARSAAVCPEPSRPGLQIELPPSHRGHAAPHCPARHCALASAERILR